MIVTTHIGTSEFTLKTSNMPTKIKNILRDYFDDELVFGGFGLGFTIHTPISATGSLWNTLKASNLIAFPTDKITAEIAFAVNAGLSLPGGETAFTFTHHDTWTASFIGP